MIDPRDTWAQLLRISGGEEIMGAALSAFMGAIGVSAIAMLWTVHRNRKVETPLNERIDAPSPNAMNWKVVHIRDDLGSLCVLIALANGLLAAILVTLIIHKPA